MVSHSPARARPSTVGRVVRVAAGNALEMYDFQIFGYYAAAIAVTFFPSGNEYASLMLSFATFGAGFLMRPLGAIVLGAYIDHHGRRKGLLLTLALMAVGTLSIACLPGYVALGLTAPLLVLAGRLLQGFSAGVELGGVSVYLSEIAAPGRKGFLVAWQSASQQVAVMFAAVIGLVLASALSAGQIQQWGWRIPFLAGCALIPFLFLLRRSLTETEAFLNRPRAPKPAEIARMVLANWRLVLLGTMMATMTTVSFYFVTAYTPTFGASVLHLAASASLVVTLCVGACNLVVLPLS
ncbi:MAG TPA: tricarballylate/proton symporter TcuC, partial [Bryobacteraceae bacterium]